MIKKLSIKSFTIISMFLIFISSGYLFYQSFLDTKNNTRVLLEENIQFNILNTKYYLEKNLNIENPNRIKPYLNNIVYTNDIIKAMTILDTKNNIIYQTTLSDDFKHDHTNCIGMSHIIDSNIFKQRCYTFSIKFFNKLEPYYYHGIIELDSNYLNMFVKNKIIKYFSFFIIYIITIMITLWLIINKVIIHPLEKLRQYAYYSTKIPRPFFINEIEGIRYSLEFTFKRLKKEQDELFNLSTRDPLSGLYNRLSLIERINWLISKGKRAKNNFAVLFLDLDNFKNINDSYGHNFGDIVLQHISEVLLNVVRDNDIVARLGGDEFVVVLTDVKNDKEILSVLKRIKIELSLPVTYEQYTYNASCSIGISLYPKDGNNVTDLLKNADIAMYKAKDLGKNDFQFFEQTLQEEIQERMKIQALMIDGLENHYFELYYQPKVDIRTNKIVACEALVRLIDPKTGIISPDKFITIAEENNFIIPLGDWIIEQATNQLRIWSNTALKDIKLSINISIVQLNNNAKLFETIKYNIKDLDVSKLDIELTESVLIKDFDEKLKIIHKLKELGLSISLDDFGTGYSSLSYLKTIPFDTIKIDKSFIDDFENSQDRSFINMIVAIANELNIEVVAEGVENKKQLEFLKDIKCQQYQGYLCSKPLPIHKFEKLFLNQV